MEKIAEDEANEVREVLEKFYGPMVRTWRINYAVYELLGQLIINSKQCTRAMHFVPRPRDISSPIKWAQKQVRQAIIRFLKTPERQYYMSNPGRSYGRL
ncbi:MAG: hypothetical protein KatS3mg122_1197 [Caldimonas sp.]|nr:MAG: hypothetical protein KatS3mg122_1197 [Caldimonas sp.]